MYYIIYKCTSGIMPNKATATDLRINIYQQSRHTVQSSAERSSLIVASYTANVMAELGPALSRLGAVPLCSVHTRT